MSTFATLLQAFGIAAVGWAVYAIAGLYLFLFVAGLLCVGLGVGIERVARDRSTTMR